MTWCTVCRCCTCSLNGMYLVSVWSLKHLCRCPDKRTWFNNGVYMQDCWFFVLFHPWFDAHDRVASVRMEEGWTVWGRVSRMTSYWDNWLLPCNNGRGGEGDKTLHLCVCVCVYNCWKKVFNTFWCIGLECALFTSYYLSGTFSALNHFIFQLPTIHTYWTETEQRKTHTHTKSEGSAAKQMYTLHGSSFLVISMNEKQGHRQLFITLPLCHVMFLSC